jgi:hypothetical protein
MTQKKMRFESEAALVQAAKEIVAPSLGRVYGLADEFDCNDGIADLVLYRLRQNGPHGKGLQLLSPRWAAALYALPYRSSFTVDWFGEVNLVSKRRALLALREYESAGFCEPMSKKGVWIKIRQPRPFASQIYAIEAKLRDWRRALSQAARYRAFAHQAWVLLDDASINPALVHLDRFVGLNVGLASISTDGEIHRHHSPEKRLPSDPWRFWYANVLIARATTQSSDVCNTN